MDPISITNMDPITPQISPQIYIYVPPMPQSAQIPAHQTREISTYTHLPRAIVRLLIDDLDEHGVDDPADIYLIFLRALQCGVYNDEALGNMPSVRAIRLRCLFYVGQFDAVDALVFTDSMDEALQWLLRRGLVSVTRARCGILQYTSNCSYSSALDVFVAWDLYLGGGALCR